MNTLQTPVVAALLERLFAEDAATAPRLAEMVGSLAEGELSRMMQRKTGYADLYARLKELPLAVSRETGTLLYLLARSCRAATIVEFGTSIGISTVHLAAALRDNGGGQLITCEFERSKLARARENLAQAKLGDLVNFREGDALLTLASDLPESIDLVLLDGAKALYPDILALLQGRLRPGALIVTDNADDSPEYLAQVRNPANGYLSVAFAEDVELSMRLG